MSFQDFFDCIDVDGSGKVSSEEFLQFSAALVSGCDNEKEKEAVAEFVSTVVASVHAKGLEEFTGDDLKGFDYEGLAVKEENMSEFEKIVKTIVENKEEILKMVKESKNVDSDEVMKALGGDKFEKLLGDKVDKANAKKD
eukprot:jgi/Bigna1/131821/aug1.15_g6529